MNWSFVHSVWTLVWHPRKPTLGVQTLCIALLLLMMASPSRSAFADCPAAPLASPDDMAISFLAANGVQASSASLLPSSVKEGMLVYDDTANKLKVCNGTNWVDVGSGGGTDTLASLSCTTGQIAKYDGTAWACAADGGGGSGPQVAFTVVKTSTQSLGSGALIDWQEAITNEGAAFDLATDKFTAPEAGLYYFHASLLTNNDTSIGDFTIYRNGSISRLRSYATHGATSYKPSVAQGVLLLNAGDVIDVRSNSASQSLFGGNGTSVTTFTGYKLGGGGSDTLSGLSCATNEIPKWNGTTWACAADGGGSGGGAEVAFRVNRNGVNQTVTSSTAANMDWTTEVFDTNNNFDLSTDRFTPTVAGKYLVTASAYCSNSTVHCLIHIYKNGTASIGEDYRSDSDTVAAVTALVDMNGTTDYLQVIVQNGGGTTINGATWLTFFSGALLGGGGSDTLAGLSCSVGEVPEWNGSAWVCGTGSGGGAAADFGAYQTITQFGTDIVAPSAGMVLHSADQAGSFCHVQIFVNGVNVATDKGYNTSSIAQSVTAPVAAGDTYRLSNDADCTNVKAFFVPLTGGSGADTLAGLSCAANEIPKWDGTTWACAADGGGSGSSGTLFSAYPSSAQAVPHGSGTKALFASESFDAKGEFASSRFTATEAGKYLLTSTVAVDGSGSGLREIWVQIWKNGTVLINGNRMSAGTLGNLYPTVTAIVDAAPGDFYEVLVYHDSVGAASQNLIPSRTFFSGAKLNGGGSSQWSDVTGGISYAAGRVGIGTPSPDASALLDMTSTAQGFLPPRMTTAQRDAIASPAAGLMIFNATMNQYQFWNGSAWSGLGGGVPAGTIAAFALAACPTGWTEYVPARGRFLRGIDPSGSTTVDAAGIRAPGSLQEGSFVMNNAGSATDIRVFNLGSEGFAGLNYDNAATSAPGFSGRWIQATGSPYVTNGSWGANTIDNNYVRVTRPKNVAVLFCQYSGGGGGGGGTAVAAGDAGQIQFNDGSDAFAADAALHWDNTNKRLGIGTTSPATSLHVNGTQIVNSGSTAPGLHVAPTSGSSYVFGANTAIGGAGLYDATGGAWRLMVKDTTGNVGIGTTNPAQKLDVAGVAEADYLIVDPQDGVDEGGEIRLKGAGSFGNIQIDNWQGNVRFHTLASGKQLQIVGGGISADGASSTNYFAGNVGIGTTSPATRLQVAGGIQLADQAGACPGASSIQLGTLKFVSDTLSICKASGWQALGSGGLASAAGSTGQIQFNGGSSTLAADAALHWDNTNKRLGIGTASPGAKLDVAGTIRSTDYLLINNSAPTIFFQDADHRSGMIHVNSNQFYVLTGNGVNSTTWAPNGSSWPLSIDLTNDSINVGGQLNLVEGILNLNGYGIAGSAGTVLDGGGGWVRTYGATGWYSQTYGGGWHMSDTTWLRAYGNKAVYTASTMRADAGFNVGGTQGISGTNSLTPVWCGGTSGSISFTGGIVTASSPYSISGGCYDVAEYYATVGDVTRGSIVALTADVSSQSIGILHPDKNEREHDSFTVKSAKAGLATHDTRSLVFGAISTASLPIGSDKKFAPGDNPRLVALAGHVPVRMTLDGGDIAIGDPITVSATTPGAGMKAITSGRIIGWAVEPFAAGMTLDDGMVEVFIAPQDWVAPQDRFAISDIESFARDGQDNRAALPSRFFAAIGEYLAGWFSDAANGITDLVAEHLRAKKASVETLCLVSSNGAPMCLTGDDIKVLKAEMAELKAANDNDEEQNAAINALRREIEALKAAR